MDMISPIVTENPRGLFVGYSNFGDVVREELDFVDKTLFIQEILDDAETQVVVITRPRRFGKTFNLSMLEHFLAPESGLLPTQGLFDGLKISRLGEKYLQHQGKYPVIFISFKDIKKDDYVSACESLRIQMAQVYMAHDYLLSSAALHDSDKDFFLTVLNRKASPAEINVSLNYLSRFLFKHTGVKPWLLMDEYDTPIQAGYLNGYYKEIVATLRELFGRALKDNTFLKRSVVTGILRVSKESLFSGLNNVEMYSVLDQKYSEHFGFTQSEIDQLLAKKELNHLSEKIRDWYNGYEFGTTTVYNPWSIVHCINKNGLLEPYWVNTSGNELISNVLARSNEQIKDDLESLIHGESITAIIEKHFVFNDLEKNKNTLWSLLLFSGYLKVTHIEPKEIRSQCELTVPNKEIMALYKTLTEDLLAAPLGHGEYLDFLLSLTEGRVEEFTERLKKYLEETLGIFDTSGKEPEKFYHGFILGMMVSLNNTHEIKSNRESGYGRYDVMLIPKDPEQLGIILEFKTVRDETTDLEKAAQQAMHQINNRHYEVELRQKGLQRILKMALAFRGKQVQVITDLA